MSIEDFDFLKGMNSGEKELYNICLNYAADDFKIIPNAIFNRHDEGTNQIDLITITKKGIFVIEMKDYKGWIFGDENHVNWTQSLIAGKGKSKKYKFRNPIKQNENHIKTLKKILSNKGYDDLPIYNVVVFGNEAVLKEVTNSIDVVNLKDMEKVFKKYRDLVITTEEINTLYDFLYGEIIKETNAMNKHLKYVNSLQPENATSDRNIRADEETKHNQLFDENNKSVESLGRFILKHKKITTIILIIILSFIIENGLMFLGIIALGTLAIKFKDRRAMGLTLLLIFVFLSSNPLGNFTSKNRQETNNSIEASTEKSSGLSVETNNNQINDNVLQEDTTSVIGDEINKDLESNDLSNNKEIVKEVDEPIINVSDNQTVENIENDVSIEKVEKIKMDETVAENQEEKINSEEAVFLEATKSLVEKVLGEPEKVTNDGTNEIWNYQSSYISFNNEGLVNGWNNRYGVLNPGMQSRKEGAEVIDIGSSKEEVLSGLGSPTKINSSNKNMWFYNAAEISFDEEGLVNGWNNRYGVLNPGMRSRKEGAEVIDIGSSKEEVLSGLGSPTKINSSNKNMWFYNAAEISFDEEGLVNGWNNRYGVLNPGMQSRKEGAEVIDIGSSKEEVLSALGSPTKINPSNMKVWYYKQAYINFDNHELVESWRDTYNILSGKVSE